MTLPSISGMTMRDYSGLPLVIRGESKEVRYLGQGLAVARFLPTIYSFTHNRCAEVPGSDLLRLRASRILVKALKREGIRHAYHQVTDRFVLTDLVLPHPVEFAKYRMEPFLPHDLEAEEIQRLPKAPPIEVIVKRYLTGTTKHRYLGMAGSTVRSTHPCYPDFPLEADGPLPEMLVRFDWRNPLREPGRGERVFQQMLGGGLEALGPMDPQLRRQIAEFLDRVPDEVEPEQQADFYIDVRRARRTAFLTGLFLEDFLASREIVFYDICLFIDESGEMVYGELSPDCGRFRSLNGISYDKDVWRAGGSSAEVLRKWEQLCELLEGGGTHEI